MRHHLQSAADALTTTNSSNSSNGKTKAYIACLGGIHCATYATPTEPMSNEPPVIYGGHFYYPSVKYTLDLWHGRYQKNDQNEQVPARMKNLNPTEATTTSSTPPFTCFTLFRDPIERIQSCWNYRMVQEHHFKHQRLATYNNDEYSNNDQKHVSIPSLLIHARDTYEMGCLNEPMRIFTSVGGDERIINHLWSNGNDEDADDDLRLLYDPSRLVQETIQRSSQCIIGILERPNETNQLLQYYLPWLADFIEFTSPSKLVQGNNTQNENDKNVVLNRGEIAKGVLPNATVAALRDVGRYEIDVYQAANRLLEQQLEQAKKHQALAAAASLQK
ncbi:MAG: hypothetical protein SGARI_002241 [Bacillariaceae sp.]